MKLILDTLGFCGGLRLVLPLGLGMGPYRLTSERGTWVCFPRVTWQGRVATQGPDWPAGTVARLASNGCLGWQPLGVLTVEAG